MTNRNALLIFLLTIVLAAFGCGDPGSTANSTNSDAANSNSTKTNSNNPVAVTTPAPEQTNNLAPTLLPVFSEYCSAMEKKDEARIRKVYSKDTLEAFAADMKAEGSKSLVEFLSSTDRVSTKMCIIRNEVITGDTAVAEIKTESMPNGVKVVFVKEGNDRKLTNRSPDVDAVKQTATNSNSGK